MKGSDDQQQFTTTINEKQYTYVKDLSGSDEIVKLFRINDP